MVKFSTVKVGTAAARRLRVRAGVDKLVFITDANRMADPLNAIRRLPAGSLVILRDYDHLNRPQLAKEVSGICRQVGCWFVVAGDVSLARKTGADGLHLPEYMLRQPPLCWHGFRFLTAACHNRQSLERARRLGVDLALVSPVFPTQSHPGKTGLGIHRFARLIEHAGLPVAALGGVSRETAGYLQGIKIAAVAGISGILD